MLLSRLPTLQKMLFPPPRLQIDLFNTQKQDKREMEPDSCQFIETGSKNASFFPDHRHALLSSHMH